MTSRRLALISMAALLLAGCDKPGGSGTPGASFRAVDITGAEYTRLHVLLYTVVLFAATLLPFVSGMSGWFYLACAVVLGAMFIGYAWKLWRVYSDQLARKTFRFSILHLSLLFAALLVDHYLGLLLR